MVVRILACAALMLGLAGPAIAQTKANQLFGAQRSASPHQAEPIGEYAKGCAAGNVQLPETGPTWQSSDRARCRYLDAARDQPEA